MSKKLLRRVFNLVTGHNILGKHMETVEDAYHFLCECPAFSSSMDQAKWAE